MQGSREPHRAVCNGLVFFINDGKSPSFIQNKYHLGRISDGLLYLNPYETLYLFLKSRISPENPWINHLETLIPSVGEEDAFIERFYLYQFLKTKGFYVKIEAGDMYYRKTPKEAYRGPVRLVREDRIISFSMLYTIEHGIYAAIDDDNDLTFFIVDAFDPRGDVITEVSEGVKIFKVLGSLCANASDLPEWMGTTMGNLKFLNAYEASLVSGSDYSAENLVMDVFRDLVDRGFIVRTGFKYGSNFRIYAKSIQDHAEFLVHVIDGTEEWYKISRAVRVAQGVRKEMIFAGEDSKKVRYVKILRVRDPFLDGIQI